MIPNDKKIDVVFLLDSHAKPIKDLIEKYGARYHRGPGIDVGIATPDDVPNNALYEIIIWKKWKYYGLILPRMV